MKKPPFNFLPKEGTKKLPSWGGYKSTPSSLPKACNKANRRIQGRRHS